MNVAIINPMKDLFSWQPFFGEVSDMQERAGVRFREFFSRSFIQEASGKEFIAFAIVRWNAVRNETEGGIYARESDILDVAGIECGGGGFTVCVDDSFEVGIRPNCSDDFTYRVFLLTASDCRSLSFVERNRQLERLIQIGLSLRADQTLKESIQHEHAA